MFAVRDAVIDEFPELLQELVEQLVKRKISRSTVMLLRAKVWEPEVVGVNVKGAIVFAQAAHHPDERRPSAEEPARCKIAAGDQRHPRAG